MKIVISNDNKAKLLMLISALSFSIMAALVKANPHSVAVKAFSRQVFSCIFVLLFIVIKNHRLIPKKEKGLRKFCLWAIGMAVLTLNKIKKNPSFTEGNQVKISRVDVKLTILITSFFVTNNTILRYLFKLSGRNLPRKISRESL